VLVQDCQGHVAQQRRGDRTLRGSGVVVSQHAVLTEDACLEERTRSIKAGREISSKQAVMSPSTTHS
jgi:hypothetical protein